MLSVCFMRNIAVLKMEESGQYNAQHEHILGNIVKSTVTYVYKKMLMMLSLVMYLKKKFNQPHDSNLSVY